MAEKKKKPTVFISQDDQYLFAQGTHYDIYEKLGAHPSCEDGEEGMFFAVWAPNAKQVYVIGEFNDWKWNLILPGSPVSVPAGPAVLRNAGYALSAW